MNELQFSPPSRNSKGFLRRMRMLLSFSAASAAGEATPEQLEDMVKFLAQYVVNEGYTEEQKIDAVWDLSEEQFSQLMSLVQMGQERLDEYAEGNESAG